MATKDKSENTDLAGQIATDGTEVTDTAERRKVAKEMRPVFAEIARLSATLSIARTACYDGDATKAMNALDLLGDQVPSAVRLAALLAPSAE